MASNPPLVDRYLERISVVAFEKYQREITDLVHSQHGLYALYKNNALYYVGLAKNLRRRVKQHLNDQHAGRWNRFSLYLFQQSIHIKEIESLLLRIAVPAGNYQTGRLRVANDLRHQLRLMLRSRQKAELEEIFTSPKAFTRVRSERVVRRKTHRRHASKRRQKDLPLSAVCGSRHIYAAYRGKLYKAFVQANGRIRFDGAVYDSLSAAAKAIRKRSTNGWAFWRARKEGRLIRLSEMRKSIEP